MSYRELQFILDQGLMRALHSFGFRICPRVLNVSSELLVRIDFIRVLEEPGLRTSKARTIVRDYRTRNAVKLALIFVTSFDSDRHKRGRSASIDLRVRNFL